MSKVLPVIANEQDFRKAIQKRGAEFVRQRRSTQNAPGRKWNFPETDLWLAQKHPGNNPWVENFTQRSTT